MTDAAAGPTSIGGIEVGALRRWLDREGLDGADLAGAELLAGGTQNILVRFEQGDRALVLRRGPTHLRPKSNDTMRREMRVLDALAGTAVPHPRLVASHPDEPAWSGGAAFYVMEAIDGFNPTTTLPARYVDDAAVRHAAGLAVVDGIAALGAVDHLAVGLDDFGRPEGFLERQVPRWLSELKSYGRHEGYPGPDIAGLDHVATWLEAHRPATFTPGLSHGDYHLANVLLDPTEPVLAAIVDWEMCTVGDPLLDLGWLLATWPDGDADAAAVAGSLGAAGDLPTRSELIDRYASGTSRDLSAIGWYEVLACFKLGIILEGTHARAFAGKAPVEIGDLLHATTLGLFARATHLIDPTERPGLR